MDTPGRCMWGVLCRIPVGYHAGLDEARHVDPLERSVPPLRGELVAYVLRTNR